jgi:3-hydroxyisobutyrate dehydrogenase
MSDKPTVALLGTGIMGAGMGHNLLKAGLPLRVWNRTKAKATPLAEAGAALFDTPAEAVTGADVIVTMLTDGPAVTEAITAAAPGLRAGQLWAQMTTVGIAPAEELAALATKHGLTIVDAPVLGTRAPAENGQLLVLAAGAESARAPLAPVFEAVGRKTMWLGDDPAAAAASRLKLVLNGWVLAVVSAGAEALALSRALGVDPQQYLDVIAGGALDSGYVQAKAANVLAGRWEPDFSVSNAAKDADLIAQAGRSNGVRLDVAEAVAARLHRAVEQGHGDKDAAATYLASFDPKG